MPVLLSASEALQVLIIRLTKNSAIHCLGDIMKILIYFFSFTLHSINHLISWIIPKSDLIWIYGEWFGEQFCDNSSYAFKATTEKKIKKIWITRNQAILKNLRDSGYFCYHAYSLLGLFYQARAKVFFCSVNSRDFCFSSLTPRNIIFQFWHGLPLKKIGYDVKNLGRIKKATNYIRSKLTDKYTYIISPSRDFDSIFSSAFRVPSDKIIRSLYPRCDGLFNSEDKRKTVLKQLNITTTKVIFYLPTHRNEGRHPEKIKSLIESVKHLNNSLLETDATLVVKPHFYDSENIKNELHGNIIITNELPFDLYTCLSSSDALITDYSSISLDYAITGKPIIYYMPDIENYLASDRESYFDLPMLVEGLCRTNNELAASIEKLFLEGIRPPAIKIDLPSKLYAESISDNFQRIAEAKIYD